MADFTSLSQVERFAVLHLLVWLACRDGDLSDQELTFTIEKRKQMGLPPLQGINKLRKLEHPKILLDAIRSWEAQELLLQDMVQMSFADGVYDARERAAVGQVVKALGLPFAKLEAVEHGLVTQLRQQIEELAVSNQSPDCQKLAQGQGWDWSKIAAIAGFGIVGGAAIAATGGLAAPVVGGAIGTTFMGLSGAAATSAGLAFLGGGSLAAGGMGMAGGTAVVATALGAGGAGLAGWKANHLFGEIKEFDIQHIDGQGLHVCLGVSGFLQQGTRQTDVWRPLSAAFPNSCNYALSWESKAQRDLFNILSTLSGRLGPAGMAAIAAQSATKKAFGMMALPAAVMSAFEIIDNPWWVANNRAEQAGKLLGDYIADQQLGGLPVSLVGYSLGTKVIVAALNRLAERGAQGKIFDVYLLAGAVAQNDARLKRIDEVICGNLVNVYSRTDWVLGYLYRTAELFAQPIGTQPLELQNISVINIDVTDSVGGHINYKEKLGYILARIQQETGQSHPYNEIDFEEPMTGRASTQTIHQNTNDLDESTLVSQLVAKLAIVEGMTQADRADFTKAETFLRFSNGVTLRTWTNLVGVDHVFVARANQQCVYGGYVGWIHSQGLEQALAGIESEYCWCVRK